MQQDLRDLFEKERERQKQNIKPKEGHQSRFLERLDEVLPQKKKQTFFSYKIAAAVLILISAAYFGLQYFNERTDTPTTIVERNNTIDKPVEFTLGDLSPDFKKIENYYVANINLELSKLEVSGDNEGLVQSYMQQLADLNVEYKNLNKELNEMGPNDQTISALIQNLQLRLQLLQKLKKKLNELNTSKNEQVETAII